jgi:hypothetical protein
MFLRADSSNPRSGNLGVLAASVLALAVVALQGCAASTVTASSAREPGSPVAGLGAIGIDPPVRVAERQAPEPRMPERAESRAREPRPVRMDSCIRCR